MQGTHSDLHSLLSPVFLPKKESASLWKNCAIRSNAVRASPLTCLTRTSRPCVPQYPLSHTECSRCLSHHSSQPNKSCSGAEW